MEETKKSIIKVRRMNDLEHEIIDQFATRIWKEIRELDNRWDIVHNHRKSVRIAFELGYIRGTSEGRKDIKKELIALIRKSLLKV